VQLKPEAPLPVKVPSTSDAVTEGVRVVVNR
jgi:hypothetical protein